MSKYREKGTGCEHIKISLAREEEQRGETR